MIYRKQICRTAFCAAGLWLGLTALASEQTIENGLLRVTVDDANGRFAIQSLHHGKASGSPVAEGVLCPLAGQAATTTIIPLFDPDWGEGKAIVLDLPGSARSTVYLYPAIPFVFFNAELHNADIAPRTENQVQLVKFTVDLGKPATDLKALGTGGLTKVDGHPGSYAYLAIADPATRRGLVTAWLTHDRGSGVVFSGIAAGKPTVTAQIDYGRLRLERFSTTITETVAIGAFEDARLGLEAWADAVAKRYGIKLKPQPAGYCTWYSDKHGGASDERAILELAAFAAKELTPYGFNFVQIDDQWQDGLRPAGTRGNGPAKNFTQVRPNGPYKNGMKPVADRISALGLTAGIWFMPFAGDHKQAWFLKHQDWFVKNDLGEAYEVPWGGTSLDLTHPEVQKYLTEMVSRIHGWGYRYFKMDGLYTGLACQPRYVNEAYAKDEFGDAVLKDPAITNVEAYRNGLKLVRQAAGPDTFFLGCCVAQNMRSLGASFGLVDAMRIGADNSARWGRAAEGCLLAGPISGSNRWFLHGRIWYNDPDPLYLRNSLPFNQARLICSWIGVTGQLAANSDWLPDVAPERLNLFKRIIPAHGLAARPVDCLDTDLPTLWTATDARLGSPRHLIGCFNWEDKPTSMAEPLERLGLNPRKTWLACEFWSGACRQITNGKLDQPMPARDAAVLALRELGPTPQLLGTNRHVSQGTIDVIAESWSYGKKQWLWCIPATDQAQGVLSGRSRVIANDPYELRIALATTGGDWTIDQAACTGGKAEIKEQKNGFARIAITPAATGEIAWSVSCKRP
jgi:hypothetical protein